MIASVPVIIAARGEAANIGRTLRSLPGEAEPIVVINGADDGTAEIARRHGATVLWSPAEGKLPAIQAGLRYLGARALEPLVTLDADSRPAMRRRWLGGLLRTRAGLDPAQPACVVGNSLYEHPNPFRGVISTAAHWRMVIRTSRDQYAGYFHGRNMLLHLQNQRTLDGVLALPNIWPGEDEAIKDEVLAGGGRVVKSLDVRAAVLTPADRALPLLTLLRIGHAASIEASYASYLAEAPADSIPRAVFVAPAADPEA
jgi:glycosyltransferase involved in cell wall biosynthesis